MRPPARASADIAVPQVALCLVTLALTLIGFVMIYSASTPLAISQGAHAAVHLIDQVKYGIIALIALFVLWKLIPYRFWTGWGTYAVWGVGALLLVLTAVAGIEENGARRWLVLGPVSLQPSEFVKIALVLMAAKLFSDFRAGVLGGRELLASAFVLLAFPVALLYATQSDLGTTAVIVLGILTVLWLGEVPARVFAVMVAVLAVLALMAVFLVSYRSERLLFLNPWNDGADGFGNGYQMIHSYYAFSQGGLLGVGLGNSREKYLYLPESETDFIFSVIGEELGMVGALAVIALFLALLWAGMRIARGAFDDFGSMLAGALTAMIVFQAFLNMGCAMGVFPTTGKPLPFISSGGSSLIATFMMVGLVLAVSEDAASPDVYRARRDDLRIVRAVGKDRSDVSRTKSRAGSRPRAR